PAPPPTAGPAVKKLIEFGWGEPDTAFLRRHLARMEETPFDGCVFHVNYTRPDGSEGPFMWEAWSSRTFTGAEMERARQDLRAIGFRRFTHSFLRFNVVPGSVDWFDDFSPIVENARLAAELAAEGRARGILFDVEQYNAPLFTYAKQRHAAVKSWEAYAAQARRRGREVMDAFQRGFPGLTVFLTFGYSGPWLETQRGRTPLVQAEYGLLVPFLDGMVEAADGATRLVDGYEPAYFHNKDLAAFARGRRTITEEVLPLVADPDKYRRLISVAFGLWLDFESPPRPWDPHDGARNFYTPEAFERSVRAALDAADEYVWIYSQTPRWWSAGGGPVQLPAGYAEGLRRARAGPAR
ncbi:MAG: hypothetical protein ACE147_11230, partial [Candidatus Methylomirabilales bacterium]